MTGGLLHRSVNRPLFSHGCSLKFIFPFELGIYYGSGMLRWRLDGFHTYDKPLVILGHKSKVCSPELFALLQYKIAFLKPRLHELDHLEETR